MLRDADTVQPSETIHTEVCVVGAGPAGITVARELAAGGLHVCLLESGDREPSSGRRGLTAGESVGYSYYDLRRTRCRAFGGSSHDWPLVEGWRARPLDHVDFESREGLPQSGWPFDRSQLQSHYERAQSVCRLGAPSYDPATWAHEDAQLGIQFPAGITPKVFQYSIEDFTHYFEEFRRSMTALLVLGATVVGIRTGDGPGAVSGVEVAARNGTRFMVQARHYVLAAGGIENARLLLLGNDRRPEGIANDHGLVGRYFMERLTVRSGIWLPSDPALLERAAYYRIRRVDGRRVQVTIGLDEQTIRREQLRNCTFFLEPRTLVSASEGVRSVVTLMRWRQLRPRPGGLLKHVRNVITDLDDVTRTAYERCRGPGASSATGFLLRAQAEATPNFRSRVTLGSRQDDFGLPVARLEWRVCDDDRASIRRTQDILESRLGRAGLGVVRARLGEGTPPALIEGAHHHMGTTRMDRNPRRGVVDEHGRVHGMANLFIAGSSVFPTVGCANPTLTIVALALRLADRIRSLRPAA